MGKALKTCFIDTDQDNTKFGYLPMMASASKGSIGALIASSFAERVISAANLIVIKGNTLLSSSEINMWVVLRMNKKIMCVMRKNCPAVTAKAASA